METLRHLNVFSDAKTLVQFEHRKTCL